MCHWNFSIDIILPAALWPLGSTQSVTEMSTMNISRGDKGGRCVGADSLITFMCWLSWNLGAWTYWTPQALSRAVMGLLYRPVRRCWQPYHLHGLIVLKSGSLNLLEPSGPVQVCSGLLYRPVRGCWQPYHLHGLIVLKSGSLNVLEPSGPVQVCNGLLYPLHKLQSILWESNYICEQVRICMKRNVAFFKGSCCFWLGTLIEVGNKYSTIYILASICLHIQGVVELSRHSHIHLHLVVQNSWLTLAITNVLSSPNIIRAIK